jgi:Protein of unknown function (DUF3987)
MNAATAPANETPQEAARRLSATKLRDGFKPEGLHVYTDAGGSPIYYKIRLRHANGDKHIRPMKANGAGFVLGEPPFPNGKPLYRLHEVAARNNECVIVTEGEKCADALVRLGLIVTTSGGADSANCADWQPLTGRDLVLWPDNDEAGARYAEAVRNHLQALGCIVRTLDVAALDLPPKGDCVEWLAAHSGATAADVLALPTVGAVESAAEVARIQTAPELLRRPVPAPLAYPRDALGPLLGQAAESLLRVIQAPDAICAGSLLAAASLAAQAFADVEIDGRRIPLSLWLLSIAESGERKSSVDTEAMRAARDYEHALAEPYAQACERHTAEFAEWEARRRAAEKECSKTGAGLADRLKAIGPAPAAPLIPRAIVGDFTAEGLAKLLAAGLPSVGAFTDEAALVFGGHGMTQETIVRTAGTLSKLWDRGELDRVRAQDGAIKLYGRRFALHLMAQPVIAERAFENEILAGQGFLARCLLAWPQQTAGFRPYCAENLRDDSALSRLLERLGALHRMPLPLAEGSRQELAPPLLRLDHDAVGLWRRFHDQIEIRMQPAGDYAPVKPWASKTPEQALRIAGVLTVIERHGSPMIDAPTMERAAEIALWHLSEAVRLIGTQQIPPAVRDAEALLEWAHATERALIHSRDVLRLGPNRIRSADAFRAAVAQLERTGWAESIPGGAEIDGAHRRNVWRILSASGAC